MSYLRHYYLGFTDSVESISIPIFTEIFQNSNIHMELQKTPSSQSHLEKEKQGWTSQHSRTWKLQLWGHVGQVLKPMHPGEAAASEEDEHCNWSVAPTC